MKNLLLLILFGVGYHGYAQPLQTQNVILITYDGLRWQEVFNGGDSALMRQQKFLKDSKIKEKFWRGDANERRKVLLPFLWNTISLKGQIYGNRTLGCKVNVTNNRWFSYPGYNEILTGRADDARITSNDKIYNPNVTVLEFLNRHSAFKNKVAAFCSWDVFPYIINDKRSGVMVSAGLVEATGPKITEKEKTLNQLMRTLPNPIPGVRLDAFTFYYGLEYIKHNKPRVLYFAFDETDDFAHGGEYAAYLNSARTTDGFIEELWNYIQSEPFYKNKTTLILTTDHGRGTTSDQWRDHGANVANASEIWLAAIGPDTPATGEVKGDHQFYQNQVANTIATILGLKFTSDQPIGNILLPMLPKK